MIDNWKKTCGCPNDCSCPKLVKFRYDYFQREKKRLGEFARSHGCTTSIVMEIPDEDFVMFKLTFSP